MKLKLTREQAAAFFAGKWPKLAGAGLPPVKAGYTHNLSSRLRFEVIRVHRDIKRHSWWLEYRVVDDREQCFYLLPSTRSLHTDEKGNVLPMPPEEEIGYTRNPKAPRADRARSVPPNVQNVLDMRAKLTKAQQPASDSELRSQERSFRGRLHAALEGLSPPAQAELLTRLERELNAVAESEERAA